MSHKTTVTVLEAFCLYRSNVEKLSITLPQNNSLVGRSLWSRLSCPCVDPEGGHDFRNGELECGENNFEESGLLQIKLILL